MQICWGGTLKKCTWFRLIVRAAALRGSEGGKDVIVIGLLQEPTATVFENYPKGRIQIASKASYVYFFHFGIFCQFCHIKIDLSGNIVWPQDLVFFFIFGIFSELLST